MSEGITPDVVVFDLDGTLVDTMASAPEAYVNTIRTLGGPVLSPERIVATWHIGPAPAVLERLLGRPVSSDDLACYYAHFENAVAKVEAFPGVREMLGELARACRRLAVFTSATKRAATFVLDRAGLSAHFPVVIGGDEVSEPKPAAAGLELACRRFGVSAGDAAYVGDALVDLQCAEAAGSRAVHAVWKPGGVPIPGRHLTARQPNDLVGLLFTAAPKERERRPRDHANGDV